MKKTIFLSLILVAALHVSAQEVVATQGGSYANSDTKIDFTIGEVIINTGSNGTIDLTQGFHQTNWKFSSLEDAKPSWIVTVFPNPASDILTIQTADFENISYTLYDETGRVVLKDQLLVETTSVQVNQLAAGTYSLVLSNQQQPLKTFKLIKTL